MFQIYLKKFFKYKYLLKDYKKIVLGRNNILKNLNNNSNREVLSIWDDYLINIGSEIIFYRNEYINKLKYQASMIYSDISDNKESFNLSYKCDIGNVENLSKDDIRKLFREKIEKNIENEIFRKNSWNHIKVPFRANTIYFIRYCQFCITGLMPVLQYIRKRRSGIAEIRLLCKHFQ